ncbi:hypothetical protein HOY80DRAFT_1009156 [Tuber brumale]|nr:hypothetical protein HOY80DRAFT_1009156 [Tuber brumale]
MAIDYGAPLSIFSFLLSSPLQLQNRHDVPRHCLRIGFMLQMSNIITIYPNITSAFFLSSSFHTPPITSSLSSSTLFYCLLRHSVNPKQ